MEGAQNIPINLEAGLNITTSDMLTSLSQPTFQHNWQKFQGKFLPNSLRFEKNGWAAGWNVYNFEYSTYREPENDYYIGIGKFNIYVNTLNIYESETSYNSLHSVYVVPEDVILVGDLKINGNEITGKIKDKEFTLIWDQNNHTLACDDTAIDLKYIINNDYSVTFTVTDITKSFDYNFTIMLPSSLTGDTINSVKYDGFKDNVHTWGQYKYNIQSNELVTPDGTTITPSIIGNELTFDYSQTITDETINILYSMQKFYPRFSKITYQDQVYKDMLLIGGSEQLRFNRYKASVSSNILTARDEAGIDIDWQLPLWFTASLGINRTNPDAIRCNNTSNYEIATMQGTGLNMKGTYTNIWQGDGSFTISDNYRLGLTKYITGLPLRFNQILLDNTIELNPNWDFRKYLLNSQVWFSTSRKYANIRNKRTLEMTKLLGDVYNWGGFSIDPHDFVDYNNPYDLSEASSCVYTKKDISNILSFKSAGSSDNTDEGNDEEFIRAELNIDNSLIATFSGTATEYDIADEAKEYDEVYVNGTYVGLTYQSVEVTDEPFWPFEKVPKFNFKDSDGNLHTGVYWTDGSQIIYDFEEFKIKVLGAYDSSIDPMNSAIFENTLYNRQRIVKQYAAGYDFDYIKKSSYSDSQKYTENKDAWNKIWNEYYPSTPSPQDSFNESVTSNDTTYLDFIDIEIIANVDPMIKYVSPGVYMFGTKAIPFNCTSGLILYNNNPEYNLSVNAWHHAERVDSQYTLEGKHQPGIARCEGNGMNIPFYFGSADRDVLVSGILSNSFTQFTSTVLLESARIVCGVNYEYVEVWHPSTSSESPGYYTYEWRRLTPKNSNWLGNLLVFYGFGSVTVFDAILNTGVEAVQGYYFTGDINEGIKFAWPVIGHSRTKLLYPEMKDLVHINDADAFVLESVPTVELSNTDVIYFDRSDTVKSQKLFNVVENSRLPDASNGTGNITLKLEAVNDAFIYYAKKQYNSNQEEIIKSFYIPGVAWGSPDDSHGFLSCQSQSPSLEIDWVPEIRKFPISALEKFSYNNTTHSQHRFYTTDMSLISDVQCVLNDIDFDTLTQDIIVKFPSGNYILHYDSATETTTGSANHSILNNDTEDVTIVAVTGTAENVTLPLIIQLDYIDNKAKFITISSYTLESSDGDSCVITDGTSSITYSIRQQDVIYPETGVSTDVVGTSNSQIVKVNCVTQDKYTCYLKAVFDGHMDDSIVSFNWRNLTFTWDLSKVVDTGISVLSTDIREPEKTKVIGRIKPEGQYQFLKQQWDTTVKVENFWWIDSMHILELNQFSLVLKRNTKELDDWNGERFEKVFETGREKILSSDIIRYFVTNVYNSIRPALFVTIKEYLGYVLISFYNPRREFELVGTQRICIKQHEISSMLNDITIEDGVALFNTYNPLTANQIISKADWSNTIVGDWLIIGCHLGNNYDQWAFVINLETMTLTKCLQGYGYVGLHGDLTGGQIPDLYFDTSKGFNSVVQPLSVLKSKDQDIHNLDAAYEISDVSKINQVTESVVGTSEQQWYISKKIFGIVSHLTFEDGEFTKQLLPITNNYAAIYDSPSFAASVFADSFVQGTPFASIFTFDETGTAIWNIIMGLLAYPMIFSLAPRFAQLIYLQQTFGQYSYVHYNSSKSLPNKEIENSTTDSGMSENKNIHTDPVLSSSFTFDKQKFTQSATTELSYFYKLMATLVGAFAESLQFLDKKIAINEEVNASTIKDTGRKFVDSVAANTGDLLASSIITQSKNDSGVISAVTGIKSLDMFYSTSDQQHVYAGPGFVEHQMVANCVAQSVTDTQVEGKVQQLYFCIRALTTLQVNTTIALENLSADLLDKLADATAAVFVCGTSLGPAAAAIHAAANAIRVAISAQEIAAKEIDKVLDAICARGITVNVDGAVSRHALSTEGKHKYGEKNEIFMWPCFGIQPGQIKYTDERVECGIRNTPWSLSLNSTKFYNRGNFNVCNFIMSWDKPKCSSNKMRSIAEAVANVGNASTWNKSHGLNDFGEAGDTYRAYYMYGNVPFYQASLFGKSEERELPDDMACVEGVNRFLPNEPFKNENISVSSPAFAPSMQQDYIVDKQWDISQYCTYGKAQWIAVKDTKLIDCPPSNMVINSEFCGIASPYTAIEVKRGIEKAYMRPWAITPNTLAFNCTGYNSILQNKLYHSFDGISYRLVSLIGSPGMNKNFQTFYYSFQLNDRFKRGNKVPANELQGNFESEPVQAVDTIDKLYTLMTTASKEKGLEAGTIGEDKDLIRWSIPVFTEHISTLPAAVKTMTAMPLGVVEGVTSLCVELANNQSAYKAPLSVDFTIGKNVYRATEEYICSVQTQNGIDIVTDLIPSLGLKFIGSTPTEAYFYSKSTRCYYTFTGSSLAKMDMMERFRDIQRGYWDFVNQEVVMPCLMTFKRLNIEVEDKDTETDNIIIPVLSRNQVSGELPPPITTIFNDRSWYKCVSLPSGFAYQGPNRVIINRAVFCEYMEKSIKDNFGKWSKMNREKYVTHRDYPEKYSNIMKDIKGVDGWTYNPFVLVTSALGSDENTDCIFEWNITFCWPVEMDLLYNVDNYACVNIMAETMTQGGKVITRPTHVFLTKELFTRNSNYGYYSFRYQSKNGMGNRERLHIWSDQYIAISSITCECKSITTRRNEQLTQQVDVERLKEL